MLVDHWLFSAVLVAFAASALVVPTMAPVAISDDWVYTRSVEILLAEGRLEILGVSAANAVFQVFWAAPFVAIAGEVFSGVRLATVIFVGLSAVALYAWCRELAVPRPLSAVAAAAYLFNPLAYVLSFTFLTDPYFVGLLIAASWLFTRALRPEHILPVPLLLGSGFAALTYLQRQQGIFLPLSVIAFLLLARRLPFDRSSVATVARIVGLPFVVAVAHGAWSAAVSPDRFAQQGFVEAVLATGVRDGTTVVARMTFVELLYIGLFVAPLAAAALWRLPLLAQRIRSGWWWGVAAWQIVIVIGLATWARGGYMPYLGPYVNREGVGPSEIIGARPPVWQEEALVWVTVACATASLVLAIAVVGALSSRAGRRSGAGLVATMGVVQAGACILPSFLFFQDDLGLSLDRYVLPLLPFALVLGAWALREVPARSVLVALLVTAVIGSYSVVATRDYLVFQQAVWSLAERTIADGADLTQLDGGYPWVGYHLHERSLEAGVEAQTPGGGPFWTRVISPLVDSTLVIATAPFDGYGSVIEQVHYSAWLDRRPTSFVLLQRDGTTSPLRISGSATP
jgi:4-amino-4-deoxy-L-arabinose transferase-like glycosyltransferase